jgi:hypothetical protein
MEFGEILDFTQLQQDLQMRLVCLVYLVVLFIFFLQE